MTKLDELQKAIEEVAEAGTEMLRKSQMSLDFSAPNPHHVAYTRTNASGTVNNIAAKGTPNKPESNFKKENRALKNGIYGGTGTAKIAAEKIAQIKEGQKPAITAGEAITKEKRRLTDAANDASYETEKNPADWTLHRAATDAHREAAEAFPKGHPANTYHSNMADKHSDQAYEGEMAEEHADTGATR